MQLLLKAFVVAALSVAILITLLLIGQVVQDRQRYRSEAVASIAATVGGAQTFTGPVLVVPFTETRQEDTPDDAGVLRHRVVRRERREIHFPNTLAISGRLPTEERKRGIHVARVYTFDGQANARFQVRLPEAEAGVMREFGQPYLTWEFTDPRGLQGTPTAVVNGQTLAVQAGAGFRQGNGVHVRLNRLTPGETATFDTRLVLKLRGTQTFSLLPLGDDSQITLTSGWSAPKFVGASPERMRTAAGFDARWQVSALANSAQATYLTPEAISERPPLPDSASTEDLMPGRISVGLISPVDAYNTISRSLKYGILFVAVTFAGFFLFEFLKAVPIHPIQYVLVGLALAIFFLLLVSLSEHIDFGYAYLISAAACIGLISYYLAAVLHGWGPALGFTALLTTLYGVLYGLLMSEDNALAMGSGLLFVILAALMVLTRRVDWYALNARRVRKPRLPAAAATVDGECA